MDVLVIGYGKIGSIKSGLWRSLGRRVFVYDVDTVKLAKARSEGFDIFVDPSFLGEDLIVDISTPASLHLESLRWTLETLDTTPRAILIEKPLASNANELMALKTLVSDAAIGKKVFVNESYYLSYALKYVADTLLAGGENIETINVELSKNRLDDVLAGRFTDPYLGTLGIELPHMIALLQGLGLDLKRINIEKVDIFRGVDHGHNEGFRLLLRHGHIGATAESYLGNFRVDSTGAPVPNEGIVRSLRVVTDKAVYHIEFDPVPGLERYKSRITILSHDKDRQEVILYDNHLAEHLSNLHFGHQTKKSELLAVDNALEIAEFIFALKSRADYYTVDSVPVATGLLPN